MSDLRASITLAISQGAGQREVATLYAQGTDTSDWQAINREIANRWPKGLERVKRLAWGGK